MLIKHRNPSAPLPSEITPKSVYLDRRSFLRTAAVAGAGMALGSLPTASLGAVTQDGKFDNLTESRFNTDEQQTPWETITTYNNFYEFGFGKEDPSLYARSLKTRPWSVEVGGLVAKPTTFGIEDILKSFPQEERIYRLRCVEAWSMVIPWVGFPLADLLNRVEPTGAAKYVAFQTLYDPEQTKVLHTVHPVM